MRQDQSTVFWQDSEDCTATSQHPQTTAELKIECQNGMHCDSMALTAPKLSQESQDLPACCMNDDTCML